MPPKLSNINTTDCKVYVNGIEVFNCNLTEPISIIKELGEYYGERKGFYFDMLPNLILSGESLRTVSITNVIK
jgi:hypothetical protein